MPHRLTVTAIEPISAKQPALVIEYTCTRCRADCRAELASPGFLPRYCLPCAAIVKRAKAAARQATWRAEHAQDAKRLGRERMQASRAAAKLASQVATSQVEPLPDWTPARFGARLSVEAVFEECSAEYERRHAVKWGWQDLHYRAKSYYASALGNAQFLGRRSAAIAAMCRYVVKGIDNAAARRDGAQPTACKPTKRIFDKPKA